MLKYLFVAQFKNGSIFHQTQEDRSISILNGSAFSDIKDKLEDLSTFGLYDPETQKNVSVDLETGKFDINGFEFAPHDTDVDFSNAIYRLIYFRRNTINFDFGVEDQQEKKTVFYIGWQTTVNGKNYKQVIGVQ